MSQQDPVALFRIEADELLGGIEQALLDLSRSSGDQGLIDTVFRGLHTLKGSGAMFGFDALAGFTHHCETAFDRVRKGVVPVTPALITVILDAQDHMRALIEGSGADIEATSEALLSNLQAAIAEAEGLESATAVEPAAAIPAGWHLYFRLPPQAMANGTNPLFLLDELRELGECRVRARTDGIPPLSELSPTECHIGWDVELRGDISRDDIEDVFIFIMDDMEMKIEPLAPDRCGEIEDALDTSASLQVEPVLGDVVPDAVDPDEARSGAPAVNSAAVKPEESVRVPAERLDVLMGRVGELVIAQSRLSQLSDGGAVVSEVALSSVSEEIERLTGELRDTIMILRMMPIAGLFNRYRRLVHDLSRETGKKIILSTEGETAEVDKTVIERLADPMLHLIRNACDHGLETPEERIAAGKPVEGRIHLSAHQAGGEVLITIRDDGRGIDRDRVRAKAEAQGLVQSDQVLSDNDLLQMIFHPGFSTASQVTSLSGRGVGMDVVKRTIESLRGAIDIKSKPGDGSAVVLRIPLTLAIIDGLLVRVGDERFVIPLAAVEKCLELSLEEDLRSRGRSFVTLHERLVPFLRLRDLFHTGTKPELHQKIVVITTGGERVGLVVDQIIGGHQTVIKSMSPLHRDVSAFAGATILGDGSLALILDVIQIVSLGQHQEERLRAAG